MGTTRLILDTNVLSMFAKERPQTRFLDFIDRVPIDLLAIPFPVLVEVYKGIEKIESEKPERARQLRRWITLMRATDISFLPAEENTALVYSKMIMVPELRYLWQVPDSRENEFKLPGQDLMIAATSIAYGYPLATLDIEDFSLIDEYFPLPGLFNPADGVWSQVRSRNAVTLRELVR
jgi:predicted nucleic acid-binding protein